MVNLVIDDTGVTEGQKIDNMEEILGKLQTCGILAVNQNESRDSSFKRSKVNNVRQLPAVSTNLKPLGIPLCPVDVRHKCHRKPKCEPNWGLCVELYKLRTVEERISSCKTSKCCYVCGTCQVTSYLTWGIRDAITKFQLKDIMQGVLHKDSSGLWIRKFQAVGLAGGKENWASDVKHYEASAGKLKAKTPKSMLFWSKNCTSF